MTVKIDVSTVYKHILSPSGAFWSEENWLNFNKLELQKKNQRRFQSPNSFKSPDSPAEHPLGVKEGIGVINIDCLNTLDHGIPYRACWPFESKMRQFVFKEIPFSHLNVDLRGWKSKVMSQPCHRFPWGSQSLKKQTNKQIKSFNQLTKLKQWVFTGKKRKTFGEDWLFFNQVKHL